MQQATPTIPQKLVVEIAAMLEAGDVDGALRAVGLDPDAFPEVRS